MLNFDQKSQFFKENHKKKTCFLPLFVQNKLKIDKKFKHYFLIAFWT